jgi:hypothetical protein
MGRDKKGISIVANLDESLLVSLQGYGVFAASHGRRTLGDHLLNTYSLLCLWNNTSTVCLAGLFHSVYGTPAYGAGVLTARDRRRLRSIIGPDAEEIVWLFHSTNTNVLIATDVVTESQRAALVEIHFANWYEQLPEAYVYVDGAYLKRTLSRFVDAKRFLGSEACRSLSLAATFLALADQKSSSNLPSGP